ncbi:MAG: AAA family ATPase [Nostoc sp. DedVER02]|uniref:trifunctional serine/threonine-protein kinase/ATP-binding protein/sensor histidine kinase n=1 Tax=unclassified Nostoc TaxID=2593658 RepID=UPI002AD5A497|nr:MULTISPECIES: AAA family ATPase [unclassified Nostoc]MDZ7985573.1 AAA family ATPase [Nostoc sp. DedVER02]MDZ8115255.1 AAA family ATPase [Nostoc sp. DedVER01b]
MLKLSGYQIIDQIYESSNSLIYRGYREADKQPVILKTLRDAYPSPECIACYQREYDITHNLHFPGIVQVYACETHQQRPVLVLEDFGGSSLAQLQLAGEIELEQFLQLAISIVESLKQIHSANIIHKDINPSNIVFNPDTKQVKIIDFGISTVLSRETQSFKNPNVLEGTITYISPEQTGRMNRVIDYRTDFYSLGVTFYKLLTGEAPFQGDDALALIHCHIAKQPDQFKIQNDARGLANAALTKFKNKQPIPQVICDIVMKLMAKNAEDRYQSAYGIQADLEQCLHKLQINGEIDVFALGSQDISDRFIIPQKLYGREPQLKTLLAAFDRVTNGTTELMLVVGYSGVGKSALVNEVHKPITAKRGNFIAGKYDQYQKNIPYFAISQAFNDLCNQLLTESESVLQQWQKKILTAVGNNGQVLIDVIPNLKLVIGEQPPVAQVGGQQAQNRFNLVFQNFIKAICQAEHPLVLFVDDLQWADSASLKLLKIILGDRNIQNLLIVGAYRDNEVDAVHPLVMTSDEIEKEGGTVSKIHVQNLTIKDVNALIAEVLSCSTIFSQALTNLICEKTQGNAFFTIEFLKSLYADMLLSFNYTQKQWCWDLEQIQAKDITDNVVELMTRKIVNLAEETQKNLQLAACIGNNFDLSTLAVISQQSAKQGLENLLPALQEGLIVPANNQYHLMSFRDEKKASKANCKFQHDRVQQAAYFLIPEAQKKETHLKIGRLMLSNTSPAKQEEKIFEIVNQLNIGAELINTQSERDQLVKLNLLAGRKAKSATAYEAAMGYFSMGSKLLAADCWQTNYELALKLFDSAAEAALLCGDFTQMNRWIEEVLQNTQVLLDKVKVYEIKITALTLEGKFQIAIATGLEVLQALGVNFPSPVNSLEQSKVLQQTAVHLAGREVKHLINLPQMQEAKQLATIQIISSIMSPAFRGGHEVLPFLILEMVNLSLEYGNTTLSTIGYVMYGLMLCGAFAEIPLGYQFGQLALSLLELYDAQYLECHIKFVFNVTICHWQQPVQKTIKPLKEAYQIGRDRGDIQFSGLCATYDSLHSWGCGENLVEVERQIASYHHAVRQVQNKIVLEYVAIYWQLTLNLLGAAENPCLLSGTAYREEQMLLWHEQASDRTGLGHLYVLKLFICYLFQDFPQAAANAQELQKYLNAVMGTTILPLLNLYDSLTALALYFDALPSEQEGLLEKVVTNQAKMQKWAQYAPTNYLHKFYLVEAERHRVLGQKAEAIEMYDRAISKAIEHQYLNEQALANELAGRFYLQWGKDRIAQDYLLNAYYAYTRWGAKAKVEDLEKRYPQFLSPTEINHQFNTSKTVSATSTTLSNFLDLNSVMKASHVLGREIKLDTLLTKLMRIVIENAGAEKGYLFLNQQGEWQIQASGTIDSDAVKIREAFAIDTFSEAMVSKAIVDYVIRTKNSVVLSDATNEGNFTHDFYIHQQQPKSILCFPLLNQGKLIGIVYLENNLTTGAFTTERIEILNLLSSQAAISIENATLYNTLEQKVAERTQELSLAVEELKATQKQLVESEKMAALGSLVAGVAHEINTPVGTSITVASTLADETRLFITAVEEGQLKRSVLNNYLEIAKESTDLILRNLNRAGELVQSFKQVAVDQTSLEQRIFVVKQYLQEIVSSLTPKLKQASHTLTVTGDEIVTIDSYPGALAQIFTNLVMNSLNHAYQPHESGQLRIEVKQQGDVYDGLRQRVVIQYSDDGCGIPPENLNKIFEPFFTTARQQGGSGLGLHIVYNLVTQKLQGTIDVHSEVEKGTLFIVTLPKVQRRD